MIADLPSSNGKALALEIGQNCIFVPCDITSPEQVSLGLDTAENTFSLPINAAINCAGIGIAMRVLHPKKGPHPLPDFEKVMRVNVVGTFNVIRLAAERMSKNTGAADGLRGVIVNTASIAAYDGQIGQAAYAGMPYPGGGRWGVRCGHVIHITMHVVLTSHHELQLLIYTYKNIFLFFLQPLKEPLLP